MTHIPATQSRKTPSNGVDHTAWNIAFTSHHGVETMATEHGSIPITTCKWPSIRPRRATPSTCAGTYYPTMKKDGTKTTVRLNKSGSPEAWYTIKTFPGEFPILNFRDQPKKQSVRGIQLDGDYWHIYGLHVTEAGDNGMKVEGSHNIIERCTFSYNDDTGLQLGFGHQFSDSHPGVSSNDGSYCAYNDVVDCDSYLNYDTDNNIRLILT